MSTDISPLQARIVSRSHVAQSHCLTPLRFALRSNSYDIDSAGQCRTYGYAIPVSLVGVTSEPDMFCYAVAPRDNVPCGDVPNGDDLTLTCPSGYFISAVSIAFALFLLALAIKNPFNWPCCQHLFFAEKDVVT